MSKATIVNLCRHILAPEQERDLRSLVGASSNAPIYSLSDLPSELREKLLNSPANEYELFLVASAVWDWVKRMWEEHEAEKLLVHLPVGSPAFMWALQTVILREKDPSLREATIVAFSHSERLVEVREGKKITSFRYSHLITFSGSELY